MPLVVLPIVTSAARCAACRAQTQDRIADVGAYAEETLLAVRTVQAFTHETADRRAFGARIERTFRPPVAHIRARAFLMATVMLLIFGAIAFVLWVGGHDVLAGRLTGGELSAFIIYAILVAGRSAPLPK